jgi:nucleoside-diphosphate-sugar epimerase
MWNEEKLDAMLSDPSPALIDDIRRIQGNILILGAGGKIGPSLCLLAQNAVKAAGIKKRILAVSRFTDALAVRLLEKNGIEIISMDLLDTAALKKLPDFENIIFMAGRKFGTRGQEAQTWAMNTSLPAFVADRYRNTNIVVFSSGNIYPPRSLLSGGCTEEDAAEPKGEYAMSCLGRERIFEHAANIYGTRVLLYRLNYALDLRYGILCDIAQKLLARQPISLRIPCFNCIWQGKANEIALRGLLHGTSPAAKLNVTGPELVYVKYAAERMAAALNVEPVFEDDVGEEAYISNASKAIELFGYPPVSAGELITWQVEWINAKGRTLDKPTHFEERGGIY